MCEIHTETNKLKLFLEVYFYAQKILHTWSSHLYVLFEHPMPDWYLPLFWEGLEFFLGICDDQAQEL